MSYLGRLVGGDIAMAKNRDQDMPDTGGYSFSCTASLEKLTGSGGEKVLGKTEFTLPPY